METITTSHRPVTPELVFSPDGAPPEGYAGYFALIDHYDDIAHPSILRHVMPDKDAIEAYVLIPNTLPNIPDVAKAIHENHRTSVYHAMESYLESLGWKKSTGLLPSEYLGKDPYIHSMKWLILDTAVPAHPRLLEPGPGIYTPDAAQQPERLTNYWDVTKLQRHLSVQFHLCGYHWHPGQDWVSQHQTSDISYTYAAGNGGDWVYECSKDGKPSIEGITRYLFARCGACPDTETQTIYLPDPTKYGELRGKDAWHIDIIYEKLAWEWKETDIRKDNRIRIDPEKYRELRQQLFATGVLDEQLERIEVDESGADPEHFTNLIPGYAKATERFLQTFRKYMPEKPMGAAAIFTENANGLTKGDLTSGEVIAEGTPATYGDIIEVQTGTTTWFMKCQRPLDNGEMEVVGVYRKNDTYASFKARVILPKTGEKMTFPYYHSGLNVSSLAYPTLLDEDIMQANISQELMRLYATYGERWQTIMREHGNKINRQRILGNRVIRLETEPADTVQVKRRMGKKAVRPTFPEFLDFLKTV